jgi:hypothetical protein
MQATFERDAQVPSRVMLRNVRIAYANGLNTPTSQTPAPGQQAGDPKYNAAFLFPESATDVLQGVQQVMWDVCVAEFKDQATNIWAELQASNKLALKSGAAKASQEGFLGNWFVSPSAKKERPPLLLHKYLRPDGKGVQELARPQNIIYSGCYVNVQIAFWAQNNNYGKRINCELLAVQFAEDGESFGGGASADTSVFGGMAAPAAQAGFGAAPAAAPFGAAPVAAPGFAAPAATPAFAAPAAQQFGAPAATAFAAPAPQSAPGFAPAAQGAPNFAPLAAPQFAAPQYAAPQFPGAPL